MIPVLAALLIGATMQQQTDTTIAVRAGSRLEVELQNGTVNVRTWNRSAVRIQATHNHRTRIDVRGQGPVLRVSAERGDNEGNADFVLTVPADIGIGASGLAMDAEVNGIRGEVSIENVMGNLRLNGGRGRVRLESVQGDISVTGATGTIEVFTVNRGIRLSGVTGTVSAETVNGSIIMEQMQTSTVNAETVNGMIVYDGALRAGGEYDLATHNGAIWLVVPKDVGASIEVETYNGNLDSSFPVTMRKSAGAGSQKFSFVLGNGSAKVSIESFGGDVRLRRPGETRPGSNGRNAPRVP